jgi:hypothetical protein
MYCTENWQQIFNETALPQSQFPHSCICERFISSFLRRIGPPFFCGSYVQGVCDGRGHLNTSTILLPMGLMSIRNISMLFWSMRFISMRHTSTRLCWSIEHKIHFFALKEYGEQLSTQLLVKLRHRYIGMDLPPTYLQCAFISRLFAASSYSLFIASLFRICTPLFLFCKRHKGKLMNMLCVPSFFTFMFFG